MSFFAELQRRNVVRVGAAYLVASWLLVQVAGTLFPLFGFDDAPTRIIVIVLAIGLIPALVCAWAFRLTPGGLRKESATGTDQLEAPGSGKRLDRIIMVVLALALGYFAFDQFVLDPRRDAATATRQAEELEQARQQGRSEAKIDGYGDQSIVVLPFTNMSDDAGNEYFSDGISEELLNLLAGVPELRVISRTSAFYYKGKDVKVTQLAEELKVAHVLEGSVRKAGDRVRITAQLIEARTDTHLWSQTWDLTLDDIFAVQQQIAGQVMEQLKVTLLEQPAPQQQTDPEAYAKFLRARFLGGRGNAESYEQAIALLEEVLAIDPDYVRAWDMLASIYINQTSKGLRPAEAGFALIRETAEKTLSIDTDFASAHSRLGWVAMLGDGDLQQSARHYERAAELAPGNERVLGDAASLLKTLGRIDECIAFDEYSVARDPLNAVGFYNLGGSYLYAGRWDEALAALETTLQLTPNRIGAWFQTGVANLLKGDATAAVAAFERESLDVLKLIGLAMGQHAAGNTVAAEEVLNDLITNWEKEAAYNISYVFAFRGETDKAFEWLDKAVEYGDPGIVEIGVEPLFRNIHEDPRWLPFLESVGRSPAQLDAIKFDVSLPAPRTKASVVL